MNNIFKTFTDFYDRVKEGAKRSKDSRETIESLEKLCIVHETLAKFRSAGLLYLDFKHHNVTVSQSIAELFFYDDDSWQRFLMQVHHWAIFQFAVLEYNKMFREAQADSEAQAYKANNNITDSERKLARLQAISKFDSEHGGKHMAIPDIHFYVLSSVDCEPILIAKYVNGVYETAKVER